MLHGRQCVAHQRITLDIWTVCARKRPDGPLQLRLLVLVGSRLHLSNEPGHLQISCLVVHPRRCEVRTRRVQVHDVDIPAGVSIYLVIEIHAIKQRAFSV